jgi:hypothetical protein
VSGRSSRRGVPGTVLRWLLGMGLMSWRYLWQTTPLHRVEERGSVDDLPPSLPAELIDDHLQRAEDGAGPFFRRRFSVTIEDATCDAASLMGMVTTDLGVLLPSEVALVEHGRRTVAGEGSLQVGDEFVIRMPGPWDGPVRVVGRDSSTLRLATLVGHLEAGQIEFRARPRDGRLVFEIETWATPATPAVRLLYSRLRLAKEMQLYMWVRAALAAARLAGGRARGGVSIRTRSLSPEVLQGSLT